MIAPVLPQLKSRFEIELAAAADDRELRELLRSSPISGQISVTFEREPSFFDSCRIRGDFFQVCVGRDQATGEIIGLGTRSVASAFINGQPQPLGYLADLRLRPQHRGGTLIARGYRFLRQLHEDRRTSFYTTVIFSENQAALTTIASGRAGLPRYHDMGTIHSPGINIRRAQTSLDVGCKIIRGSQDLLPAIVECLNRNNARRQFAPSANPLLKVRDTLILFREEFQRALYLYSPRAQNLSHCDGLGCCCDLDFIGLVAAEDSIAKTFVTKWVAAFRAANITTRYSAVSRLMQTIKLLMRPPRQQYEQGENEKNWW